MPDELLNDALTAEQRKNLKDSDFALPSKRMFPIHNKSHIKMAWDMVDRAKGLSDAEKKLARKNILAAAKSTGLDTAGWDKSAMTDSIMSSAEILLDAKKEDDAKELPPGVIMRARHKGTKSNVINFNDRMYPDPVMTDSVQLANEKYVKTGQMIMEYPHPHTYMDSQGNIQFKTNLNNRAARIVNLWKDGDQVYFDADILDTSMGRDIAAQIRAGLPVPVSMRALGSSVRKIIDGRNINVATQMDIRTFDYVGEAATEGSGVEGIVIEDSQMAAIMDGLQFNDPVCPQDGSQLVPVDPDQDNDVEYWACPKCQTRYNVYNGIEVTHQARQYVSRRYDSPDLGADRALAEPPGKTLPGDDSDNIVIPPDGMTDSITQKGDEIMGMNQEQLEKFFAEKLAPFQAMKDEQERAQQALQAKKEAEEFIDAKLAELKDKHPQAVLDTVKKAVGEPQNKEQAQLVLDSVLNMASQATAADFLKSLGMETITDAAEGQSRVQVGHEPKPWGKLVDSLAKEFDRIDAEKGFSPDPALRKLNKEFVDKILAKHEANVGFEAMKDSAKQVDALLDSGASVTTSALLNQPTIQSVILLQKFQDLESTQFMMTDVFEGSEWRIPSESFSGSDSLDPSTLLFDIVSPENSAISEAKVDVIWASFTPQARRNAISLTTDAIRAMGTGPLKYNAPARAIYHIGKEAARKIDTYAYWDMAVTADEYNPLVVTNEDITVSAVSNGTNVAFSGNLTAGGAAGTTSNGFTFAAAGKLPIVRPRTKQVINANGSVTKTTTNAISCTVGGTALVLGGLDSNGNIVGKDSNGNSANYAIDFENGIAYFATGLGITPGTTDPKISYSASRNYDIWNSAMTSGYTKEEDYYNTLLMQLSKTAALMGSAPRYNAPNLALFSLNSANYVRNAQMFYKLAQPAGVSLNPTQNNFGKRDEMDLYKLNAPWVLGDNRILLHQRNATRYGIQTPYKVEGPITKQDPTTGNLLPVKAWYGEEFSVICTPQILDASGNVLNPTSRTIKIV